MTSVEGIKFHTERSRPGRVLPKEKRILVLKDPSQNKVHDLLKSKFKKTAFSDLASLFSKEKRRKVEQEYKDKLKTIKAGEEIKSKTQDLKSQLSSLEQEIKSPEVKSLIDEAKSFRFKSGSTSESISSAAAALALVKKLKSKRKEIKKEIRAIQSNAKLLKTSVREAPEQFLADISGLKVALDPKQLSSEKISEDVLSEYFSLQLAQVGRATTSLKNQALGDKAQYVDMSTASSKAQKDKSSEEISQVSLEKSREEIIKEKSKDFIFVKSKLLPKYWFKQINISSEASEGQDFGDVTGLITDFSAAPELLDSIMTLKIEGSVPKQGIGNFGINAKLDHRTPGKEKEEVIINVSDYIIKGLELFEGSDEWVKIVESNSKTKLKVTLKEDFIDLHLNQTLRSPNYDIFSKDKYVEKLMKGLQSSQSDLELSLKASGDISSPKLRISSNLGDILLDLIKRNLSDAVSSLAKEQLGKIEQEALSKLSPYIKDIERTSLKTLDLEKALDKEIERGLSKLNKKGKSKKDLKKELKDKLLKKLFN